MDRARSSHYPRQAHLKSAYSQPAIAGLLDSGTFGVGLLELDNSLLWEDIDFRMFSIITGLYLLDASSSHLPPAVATRRVSRHAKYPLREKTTPD